MKPIVIAIAAVAALAASPALAESWHVVSRSSATVFMLDVDSITEGDGARTALLARVPASGATDDLSYSAGQISIRCSANQSKPGVEVLYGPDGAEQERVAAAERAASLEREAARADAEADRIDPS